MYERLIFLKPLTSEDIFYVAETMVDRFKLSTIDEMLAKKKNKKAKGKELEGATEAPRENSFP